MKDFEERRRVLLDLGKETVKDDNITLETFKTMIQDINAKKSSSEVLPINQKITRYAMFSASISESKPNNILSQRCAGLDINKYFSREEQYGQYMDFENFYLEWLNVVKTGDVTLLQFLNLLRVFMDEEKYLTHPPMDRKNNRYMKFLESLCSYVESFFFRKYALINKSAITSQIESQFTEYIKEPTEHSVKGQYCKACAKWFKTESVFVNHIPGKNHIKNEKQRKNALLSEYKLHRFFFLLQEEFKETYEFIEMKMALTADERMEEMKRLTENYEKPAYSSDEKEGDENNADLEHDEQRSGKGQGLLEGSFDMPLGPDGLPMPFWLYKLQGLDVEYPCEICSNQIFKGRRAFEKHFTAPTHQYHLRCLGIEPSSMFKGITKIKEAQKLWVDINSQKNSSKPMVSSIELQVEVEDSVGNVMSKKLYDELKKQGLH